MSAVNVPYGCMSRSLRRSTMAELVTARPPSRTGGDSSSPSGEDPSANQQRCGGPAADLAAAAAAAATVNSRCSNIAGIRRSAALSHSALAQFDGLP